MTNNTAKPAGTPKDPEPEVTNEEAIPSDGKDEVGEKMMEELGRQNGVAQTQTPNTAKD